MPERGSVNATGPPRPPLRQPRLAIAQATSRPPAGDLAFGVAMTTRGKTETGSARKPTPSEDSPTGSSGQWTPAKKWPLAPVPNWSSHATGLRSLR